MQSKFRLFILIFFVLSLFPCFVFSQPTDSAQTVSKKMPPFPPPRNRMNFNGRRMSRHEGNFSMIGVRLEEFGGQIVFSAYFNEPIDTNSIHHKNILLNEIPLSKETEIFFNKARRMLRFTVQESEFSTADGVPSSLKIMHVKSFSGKSMKPTEIKNLETNSFFKYSPEAGTWQKS